MTMGPDGALQPMAGDQLTAFWDKHCPNTMGGFCTYDTDDKCRRCHRQKPHTTPAPAVFD